MEEKEEEEYDKEEIREIFLEKMVVLIDKWMPYSEIRPIRQLMENLLYSFLATIDGYHGSMPSFSLIPESDCGHVPDHWFNKEGSKKWPGWDAEMNIGGKLRKELKKHIHRNVEKDMPSWERDLHLHRMHMKRRKKNVTSC